LIGFHFDPLVEFEGWESGYEEVVEEIFAQIDPRRIAWVSLGSLRLTPDLWGHVRRREKGSIVLGSEMVPCADGKWRVWQGLRLRMYRRLTYAIRRRAPEVPLYLCMEGPGVWEKVLGERPTDRELGGRLAAGVIG
jgi:spore photoproduct lyase